MDASHIINSMRQRGLILEIEIKKGLIHVKPPSLLTDSDRVLIREIKPLLVKVLHDELVEAEYDRYARQDGWDGSRGGSANDSVTNLDSWNIEPGPATFLASYTPEHAARISQARALALDLETTSLTPWSEQVKAVTKVGSRQYQRKGAPRETTVRFFTPDPDNFGACYTDSFPDCRIDTTRRIRVVTVQLIESGWLAAWDLDLLPVEERQRLLHDLVEGKILVGDNISFDLAWLSHLTDAMPARILDSMLIAKWHAHSSRLMVQMRAADGDHACERLVRKAGPGGVGFGLRECAAAFGLAIPDKVFEPACNWCVSALSPGHYEYCIGDVTLPLTIIKKTLGLEGDARLDTILARLAGGVYEADCEPAQFNLVGIHRRGIPVSIETIEALAAEFEREAGEQASAIIALAPEILTAVSADLKKGSITNALRCAIQTYLNTQGKSPLKTGTGTLSMAEDAFIKAGLAKDPVIAGFLKITSARKQIEMLQTWRRHIDNGGRVHSLLAVDTLSGRMSSQAPNAHGLAKGLPRRIVKAEPGNLLIKADLSQIELRVASAIVVRELRSVKNHLDGTRKLKLPYWIQEPLENARRRYEQGGPPPSLCVDGASVMQKQAAELAYSYYEVLRRGPTMSALLQEGLDVHLMTRLSMAVRAGKIDLKGRSEIDYLRANQHVLKRELATERAAAKALNFGLLYGMSATGIDGEGGLYDHGKTKYGLTWSRQEAEEHRTAWFALYPEFRWWHVWTQLALTTAPLKLLAIGYDGLKAQEHAWTVSTLRGREMAALRKRDALNYPVQGSGAELILRVLPRLPEPAQRCMINVIHDEILLEAPAAQAELVRSLVVKAMVDAGNEILGPYGIQAEVESAVGDNWDMCV